MVSSSSMIPASHSPRAGGPSSGWYAKPSIFICCGKNGSERVCRFAGSLPVYNRSAGRRPAPYFPERELFMQAHDRDRTAQHDLFGATFMKLQEAMAFWKDHQPVGLMVLQVFLDAVPDLCLTDKMQFRGKCPDIFFPDIVFCNGFCGVAFAIR